MSGAFRAARESERPTLTPVSGERQTESGPAPARRRGPGFAHDARSATDERVLEMHRRLARHDYDAALDIARAVLAERPHDAVALECMMTCQDALEELYHFALASLLRVPVRIAAADRVTSLPLEPTHAFVLALVDGVSTVETVLDMTGNPRHVGLQALFALEKWRIIALR